MVHTCENTRVRPARGPTSCAGACRGGGAVDVDALIATDDDEAGSLHEYLACRGMISTLSRRPRVLMSRHGCEHTPRTPAGGSAKPRPWPWRYSVSVMPTCGSDVRTLDQAPGCCWNVAVGDVSARSLRPYPQSRSNSQFPRSGGSQRASYLEITRHDRDASPRDRRRLAVCRPRPACEVPR